MHPLPNRGLIAIMGRIPVTIEPSIDPTLKSKIEAVHNSVAGHFGVEYTRKVLLGRGVNDEGLRRAVTKYVRECPVCQLRSVLNRQIKTHRFTTVCPPGPHTCL